MKRTGWMPGMARLGTSMLILGIAQALMGAVTPSSPAAHAAEAPETAIREDQPLVGAIRWDGWFEGNPWQKNLDPAQWHDRLPFFAVKTDDGKVDIVADSQEVMEQEIAYARAGGLSYWAFCYYHPKSWPDADQYNHGWKRYLASKDKRGLNFCLLLQGGGHLGPAEEWPQTVARFVRFFKESTYQRVLGGRPLLYIFYCEHLVPHFGSMDAAREAFDLLRQESVKADAGDPYIVAQLWLHMLEEPFLKELGFDAVGAYSAHGDDAPNLSYARLTELNRYYWEQHKATGHSVVPTINAGWDGRPRDYKGSWFVQPTPDAMATNLRGAMNWVAANPKIAAANTVLIYAWNEFDEGGWICPTLSEGTARLDAISKVLRPDAVTVPETEDEEQD